MIGVFIIAVLLLAVLTAGFQADRSSPPRRPTIVPPPPAIIDRDHPLFSIGGGRRGPEPRRPR